ncbi:aminopeptidase C [Lactococcus termiticola]|uniref:Aminopeptidase n=1 Tax=Lactococcus termiticola TaxID=2169526 RepID=A0A2R5HG45_9LACT|nr:aminopeptidase C [Lactococcus termiticola]GBG97029.1 aminopeptidase C [Lactococcus termiticola]
MTITEDFTQKLYDKFLADKTLQAVENAATKNGLLNALENRASHAKNLPEFSIDLTKDKVTNQKQSGRCWMFAAMNTFRHPLIGDYNLKDFEFSQAYPFFWDKYEKANWFMEQIIQNPEMDDRRLKFLLQTPQQDGGQWDMIVAIFQKYGVVPKAIYPESEASSNSRELNQYLDKLLRQNAEILINAMKSGKDVAGIKEAMLHEVFNYLAATLGLPPQEFDFAFRDKDGENFTRFSGTPKDFYNKFVGTNLDDYVSIINAPTVDKPYNQSYSVEFLGNVVGGKPVKHLNVDMDRFKKLAIAQMQAGETVWFGCDVAQLSNRKDGLLTLDSYDFSAVGLNFTQSKAARLDYGESLMTHAMVLAGVDLDEAGNPKQWKVENSWGKDAGSFDGYFVASDEWMDEYTYQIVVRKDLLTAEELKAYEAEPQVLLPWDPMGALA